MSRPDTKYKMRFGRAQGIRVASYVIMLGATVFVLFPLVYMLLVSLKDPSEIFNIPVTYLPKNLTLENYIRVFREYDFNRNVLNSLVVGISTTAITVPISAIAAYAFSRFRFPGRDLLATSLLVGLMIPASMVVIPLYLIWARLGMLDSYSPMILTYIAFNVSFSVWLLIGFFDAVPKELEEAAWIDGAGWTRTFVHVVLPLTAPGLAAVAIFCFIISWQEFLFALTFTSSAEMRTITVGLASFAQQRLTDWGAMMAASASVLVPILVMFRYFERYLIAGLMAGAVKQ